MSSANGKGKTSGAVQASAHSKMSQQEREILDAQLAAVRAGMTRLGNEGRYGAYRQAQDLLQTLYQRIGKTSNTDARLQRS
jgi:cell division protein FtsI/penicillin-binding protein 2